MNSKQNGEQLEKAPNQANIERDLQRAIDLHQTGKLQQAELIYQQILQTHPQHSTALHLLGVIAYQSDNLAMAVGLIEQATKIDPNQSSGFFSLGLALKKQGRLKDAINAYYKVLEIEPQNANAYNNLGNILGLSGKLEQAVGVYRQALEINPSDIRTYNNLSMALQKQGKLTEAIDTYYKILEMDSTNVAIHRSLGMLLTEQGKLEEAINTYYQVLKIDSTDAKTYNNLGILLKEQGKFKEAVDAYCKALEIVPSYADAYNNLGNAFQLQGNFEDAEVAYKKALEINSKFSEAHKNLGMLLLLNGEFELGWKKYEWRWKCHDFPSENRNFPQLSWDGTDLSKKSILIWTEQGIGDEIMFANMLETLSWMTDEITVECEERLVPLFQRSFPKMQFVSREQKPNPILLDRQIDYQIPIGSLAQWLRKNENQFPKKGSYLSASSEKASQLRDKYENLTDGRFLVGISWKSINHGTEKEKNTILENWTPILSQKDCFFINLQYGNTEQEISKYCSSTGTLIYTDQEINPLKNLDDFAAQISALDLVISISNTTAHMSGALGKKVWTLLPYVPDWRWMLKREDTPWYPNMKLFRQSQMHDWRDVFQRVSLSLKLDIKRQN